MAEDSAAGVALAAVGGALLGGAIVGLIASALRPRECAREVVKGLRQDPILPRARPIQRIMCWADRGRPMTAIETVTAEEPSGDDPRLYVTRGEGVCDSAKVYPDRGMTPAGHKGDLVTLRRCVLDLELRGSQA